MFSRLYSAAVYGINGFIVEIETHLDQGLPAMIVVGLPDSAVKESRERVSAALKNSGFGVPLKKITVNLAPADIRKEGTAFDLPIALGILVSNEIIINQEKLDKTIALGELSLEGVLRPIHGSLSIAVEARDRGFTRLLIPEQNAREAALVEGIDIIPIKDLAQCTDYLNGILDIPPCKIDVEQIFQDSQARFLLNFTDVKGQENSKRALEVAAAGGHNILMLGPPGSGKTMLAKRIPTILPPLSINESLETTKIHSVAGILSRDEALLTSRPFRSPHHTISDAALVGGGMSKIRPGEISLSHHGVLFLDELPEFDRNVLEVLRQPLEDKCITISRTKLTVEYPANFMLVCSMNPCPCGNFGNPRKECSCSQIQIEKYMSKISGPLLDRIDIHIEVPALNYQEISATRLGESSEKVRLRVLEARKRQEWRFKGKKDVFKNSDMNAKELREFCKLDEASHQLLKMAMTKLGISARGYDRILKVARTIADLSDSTDIQSNHVAEAIQYRSLDREFWKK